MNLIDRLPRASHLRHELSQDEDLARRQAEMEDRHPVRTPDISPPVPLTEWTTEAEFLAAAVDRLGELAALIASTHAEKRVSPPPRMPRPSTALARLRAAASETSYSELMAMFDEPSDPEAGG